MPNEIVKKFFELWNKGQFNEMIELLQKTWLSNHNWIEWSSNNLKELKPVKWRLGEIKRKGEYCQDVQVLLNYKIKSTKRRVNVKIRTIKELAPHTPGDGQWGINPVSLLKGLY